ncbi:hypothetical protein THMIRHAS_02020 [Thiosulfatimonas sediminis]|uniref:Uncharacterized protein n=1 Tax=Thiosulfatimonas sediminis TaxID=2675054 RepID=A0A6F8PRU3_9GAMM|nr:hypothetical protein [Thiosulfatimonas sediminis]BBP44829.1 hypothetical protein THMIRHAS_02020 [Thiosulfatimonas sediminis]
MASKKRPLPMFWLVFIASMVIFALMLLIQPQRDATAEAHLPWNAKFAADGQLHALGLVVGQSSVNDAVKLYGKDVELKMFTDLDESNKTVEAYFPVMYIGSIKAALAMQIIVPEEQLQQTFNNGKKIVMSSSGGREIELYNQDKIALMSLPVSSITLIPRKHLTERAIQMRFGEPSRKETQSDGLQHWFFDSLGLEMILDPEGPEALQYTNQSAR